MQPISLLHINSLYASIVSSSTNSDPLCLQWHFSSTTIRNTILAQDDFTVIAQHHFNDEGAETSAFVVILVSVNKSMYVSIL